MTLDDNLPSDVLLEIFKLVGRDKRAPLLNAARVSRSWHNIAQLVIDQAIDLTISVPYKSRNLNILHRLAKQTQLRSRAVHLIIRDCHTEQRVPLGVSDEPPVNAWSDGEYLSKTYDVLDPSKPGIRVQLEAVVQAIAVAQLTSFTWAAVPPLPHILATSLVSKQSMSIHIRVNPAAISTAAWSWTPVVNFAILRRLRTISSQITSLELCLPLGDVRARSLLRELGALIWTCPRLQVLKLHALGRQSVRNDSLSRHFPSINGPRRAGAVRATVAKFWRWSTNAGPVCPNIFLEDISPNGTEIISFPPSLTTLALQHFCVCEIRDMKVLNIPQMPALSTLKVSCLLLLNAMKSATPRMQSLALSCAQHVTYGGQQRIRSADSCACTTFWPSSEICGTLMSIDGIEELSVLGHCPVVLDEPTCIHLGKTLRCLSLLSGEPHDYKAGLVNTVDNDAEHRRLKLCEVRDLVSLLRAVCPLLIELSLDAPNASTEFDVLLEAIVEHLASLQRLHLCRSLEPYGDSTLPSQLSYARFTENSVLAVWKILTKSNLNLELKITIGNGKSWDSSPRPSSIGPVGRSRTFTVVRKSQVGDERSDSNGYSITPHEKIEADSAMIEGRPGPLKGFWQAQAEAMNEFFLEENIPIRRRALLENGRETSRSCRMPSMEARRDPVAMERRRQAFQPFQDAMKAQHDAEVREAANPTRPFY